MVKKEEDKEKVAALLVIYVAKYQQEKQEVNNTNGFYSSIGTELIGLIDNSTEAGKALKEVGETVTPMNNQEDQQKV
ncbi:hypothetical protein H7F28_20180 [Brevibacterium sp. PAMC23299]|nr:hypothetical protein H7F28_20180 [Brevibacterium sp. PAMC23299]